jgi:hypothetical protein
MHKKKNHEYKFSWHLEGVKPAFTASTVRKIMKIIIINYKLKKTISLNIIKSPSAKRV